MNKPSIKEMEKALGLDKVKPIQVSDSVQKEFENDDDYFRQWYEEELYAKYKELLETE